MTNNRIRTRKKKSLSKYNSKKKYSLKGGAGNPQLNKLLASAPSSNPSSAHSSTPSSTPSSTSSPSLSSSSNNFITLVTRLKKAKKKAREEAKQRIRSARQIREHEKRTRRTRRRTKKMRRIERERIEEEKKTKKKPKKKAKKKEKQKKKKGTSSSDTSNGTKQQTIPGMMPGMQMMPGMMPGMMMPMMPGSVTPVDPKEILNIQQLSAIQWLLTTKEDEYKKIGYIILDSNSNSKIDTIMDNRYKELFTNAVSKFKNKIGARNIPSQSQSSGMNLNPNKNNTKGTIPSNYTQGTNRWYYNHNTGQYVKKALNASAGSPHSSYDANSINGKRPPPNLLSIEENKSSTYYAGINTLWTVLHDFEAYRTLPVEIAGGGNAWIKFKKSGKGKTEMPDIFKHKKEQINMVAKDSQRLEEVVVRANVYTPPYKGISKGDPITIMKRHDPGVFMTKEHIEVSKNDKAKSLRQITDGVNTWKIDSDFSAYELEMLEVNNNEDKNDIIFIRDYNVANTTVPKKKLLIKALN